MPKLTTDELTAIRGRCRDAPPGPWYAAGDSLDDARGVTFAEAAGGIDSRAHDVFCQALEFMAAARSDVPALLNMVAALQAELRDVRHELALVAVRK